MSDLSFVPTVPLRQACLDDLDEVCALLRGMHAEVAMAPLCEEKMIAAVQDAIRHGLVMLSFAEDGAAVGTCSVLATEHWYSRSLFVGDLWFYVDPRHRRGGHARTLLRAIKVYAKAIKLPLMVGVIGPPDRIKVKARLYQREFGQPIGMMFGMGMV